MNVRARPGSIETAGVRSRVLGAAAQLLATQPAEDLSLRVIAEAAGVGLASIYHYFASKEELLLHLAMEGLETLRRDIMALQADPEIGSPMRGGHRAFFSFLRTKPALFSLMFNERMLARHAEMREAEDRAFLAYQAAVQADSRIPARQQENAARAIWALGRGMAAMNASQPDGQLPPDIAEKLSAGALYLIDRPPEDA
ncbi:TetR/AcrR family transcriptional regulator [Phenylobacterium sp.]|jgi:AcrR family transcriptional regulator|uniref:TetR/AcrR family transcriptional regulator n=1 Tax=Phenylobacterium sp. TaxID=1871053 RepID=UPI002F3F1080